VPDEALAAAATIGRTEAIERDAFWPEQHGILLIKSVPIWVDERQPDVLGTLILGESLNYLKASTFRTQTNSEIAFGVNGAIKVATLPESTWPALIPLLGNPGVRTSVTLNGEDYLALANPLGPAGPRGQPIVIVLRAQTERQKFLSDLHFQLGLTAVFAVLASILLSYAVARTVTRPVEAITSTMREMAASGDLTRRIRVSPDGWWQDEDARLLATTFNSMTDSIEKFQREATQRERLSSLGRLSTVVAHEIRNPLMIIKTSLRTLRREDAAADQVKTAVKDIDEEVTRLNRIVAESPGLRPPHQVRARTGQSERDGAGRGPRRRRRGRQRADPPRAGRRHPLMRTDMERLRQALLNILSNAVQAVAGRQADIRLRTLLIDPRRLAIIVTDNGGGIAPEDLPRLFDPYFTTRRTGTGIGLAILPEHHRRPGRAHHRRQRTRSRHRSAHRAPPRRPDRMTKTTGSILLVDDETKIREALAKALREEGTRSWRPLPPRSAGPPGARIVRRAPRRQPDAGADRSRSDPRAGRDDARRGTARKSC